jgi:hypothetical protein
MPGTNYSNQEYGYPLKIVFHKEIFWLTKTELFDIKKIHREHNPGGSVSEL